MSDLYLIFWTIFILVFPAFFLIKFIVNYISLNGKKPLLMVFNKDNKLFLGLMFGFIIIFWLAFFFIYYFNIYPRLYVTKLSFDTERNGVYMSEKTWCYINSNYPKIEDCPKFKSLGQGNTLEITRTNRDYVKFKLNTSVVVTRCTNCDFTYLKVDEEYKITKNQKISFNIIDEKENVRYSYDIYLEE